MFLIEVRYIVSRCPECPWCPWKIIFPPFDVLEEREPEPKIDLLQPRSLLISRWRNVERGETKKKCGYCGHHGRSASDDASYRPRWMHATTHTVAYWWYHKVVIHFVIRCAIRDVIRGVWFRTSRRLEKKRKKNQSRKTQLTIKHRPRPQREASPLPRRHIADNTYIHGDVC